jgi:hypothetical protein
MICVDDSAPLASITCSVSCKCPRRRGAAGALTLTTATRAGNGYWRPGAA